MYMGSLCFNGNKFLFFIIVAFRVVFAGNVVIVVFLILIFLLIFVVNVCFVCIFF